MTYLHFVIILLTLTALYIFQKTCIFSWKQISQSSKFLRSFLPLVCLVTFFICRFVRLYFLICCLVYVFFKKLGFLLSKAEEPLQGMELQNKKENNEMIEESFLERAQIKKLCVNSRLKVIVIRGQRKELHRQGTPKSSSLRKWTVEIDILKTSRNGERKIMQPVIIKSRPTIRMRKQN